MCTIATQKRTEIYSLSYYFVYDHIIVWIFFFDNEWRDVASVLVVKNLLFSVIEWQQAVPWIFLCILEMLVVER